MARARMLKPGFFKNEGLAELRPPETAAPMPAAAFAVRLCYEGLWLLADRSGRLEDRPKRIKAELFPYDDVDVDQLLITLAAHGFIVRYTVNGDTYIAITTFPKHQHPHVNEPSSVIPPPPKKPAPDTHHASTVRAPEGNGAATVPKRLDPESESCIRSLDPESESRTNALATSTKRSTVQQVLAANKKKYRREKLRGRL